MQSTTHCLVSFVSIIYLYLYLLLNCENFSLSISGVRSSSGTSCRVVQTFLGFPMQILLYTSKCESIGSRCKVFLLFFVVPSPPRSVTGGENKIEIF